MSAIAGEHAETAATGLLTRARLKWLTYATLGGLIAFGDVGGAVELEPDRAHPDGHPALVLVVAEVLGQFRAGQAGRHLRDVAEELPHLLDRLGDLEAAGDDHLSTALM